MKTPRTAKDSGTLRPRIKVPARRDWKHVAVLGGMFVSLGAVALTGLKKWRVPHIVSSLCFAGLALGHLFIHRKAFSFRMKRALKPRNTKVGSKITPDDSESSEDPSKRQLGQEE